MFFTCLFLVMHLWQIFLYQFPRWDQAMRHISRLQNFSFQISMLVIAVGTVLTLGGLFLSLFLPHIYETYFHLLWLPDPETWAWIALLGWTTWLAVFAQVALVNGPTGEQWVSRHQPVAGPEQVPRTGTGDVSLQNMGRSLRVSQILLYLLFFLIASGANGYLKAQLDLTLITVATPATVVGMYGLVVVFMQLNSTITYVAAPLCFMLSLSVCTFMTSHIGGKGSIMLVFAHSIGKSLQYFGNDLPGHEEEEDEYEDQNDEGGGKGGREDEEGRNTQQRDLTPVRESFLTPMSFAAEELIAQVGDTGTPLRFNRQRSGSRSYEDLCRMTTATTSSSSEDVRDGRGSGLTKTPASIGRRTTSYNDLAYASRRADGSGLLGGSGVAAGQTASHTEALATLAGRGQMDSALVSVELPESLRNHWLLKFSSRTIGFGVHMARSMTLTNTALAGVMKAGTALGVVMTLILGLISVLSVLQQNMQLFPKLISYHTSTNDILLNHIISNVTLVKNPAVYSPNSTESSAHTQPFSRLKKPYYVACDLRWNSLSLLDFAIFSELAYFDDEGPGEGEAQMQMQRMLDELFPQMGFEHVRGSSSDEEGGATCGVSVAEEDGVYWGGRGRDVCAGGAGKAGHRRGDAVPEWVRRAIVGGVGAGGDLEQEAASLRSRGFTGGHPMYLEAYSNQLGVTVIAVRGTDVGRLHDFLEDVKLFAEPVLLSLLSCVFPLMRLWSDTTTSTVIEILHESNNFFGLVGEAEYYQPLVRRVRAIAAGPRNSPGNDNGSSSHRVILTGHSLGGGLSRIVGALARLPSVSFSPPGIALSHRKYGVLEDVLDADGEDRGLQVRRRIRGLKSLHDQSMAVLTESDWYVTRHRFAGSSYVYVVLC
jgi:hypothetical protein